MTRRWPLFKRNYVAFLFGILWLCLPSITQAQSSSSPAVSSPRAETDLRSAPPRFDPFTPHVPRQAVLYQRSAYTLGLFGLAWHGLGIWLLLRTGMSARLRNAVYRLARRPPPHHGKAPPLAAVALFVMAYLVYMLAWTLPIGLAGLALSTLR